MKKKLAYTKQKPEHFVKQLPTGVITIGGKKPTPDQIRSLQAEIEAIRGTQVWQLLHENVIQDGKERIYETATNLLQLNYGRAILHTLGLQDAIMDKIMQLSTHVVSPIRKSYVDMV